MQAAFLPGNASCGLTEHCDVAPGGIETHIYVPRMKSGEQSLGFSVGSSSTNVLYLAWGRCCGGHMCLSQCPGGPGVPAGAPLPHGAMGRRSEATAPSHRAQCCGELPVKDIGKGPLCPHWNRCQGWHRDPAQFLPFQKVLLENIPVWELLIKASLENPGCR
jgi:hypothetical protein